MPLNKREKVEILEKNLKESFPNSSYSICQIDKGIYPMYGNRHSLAMVEFPALVFKIGKREFDDYFAKIITDDPFVRGYCACSNNIVMAVSGIVFESNAFTLVGEIVFMDSNSKKPVQLYMMYSDFCLDDIWPLSEFEVEKLAWLESFGCKRSLDAINYLSEGLNEELDDSLLDVDNDSLNDDFSDNTVPQHCDKNTVGRGLFSEMVKKGSDTPSRYV